MKWIGLMCIGIYVSKTIKFRILRLRIHPWKVKIQDNEYFEEKKHTLITMEEIRVLNHAEVCVIYEKYLTSFEWYNPVLHFKLVYSGSPLRCIAHNVRSKIVGSM